MEVVAKSFFPLGFVAFGGPPSNVAFLERLFVDRLGLITGERFSELLAICSALPGSTSAQLASAIGGHMGGLAGFIAAFLFFVWPGLVLMLIAGKYLTVAESILSRIAPEWIYAAAVSVLLVASVTLFSRVVNTTLATILSVVSAAVALSVPSQYFPLIPIGAGLLSAVVTSTRLPMGGGTPLLVGGGGASPVGKLSVLQAQLSLVLLVGLGLAAFFSEVLLGRFFFAGASVFGGGTMIVPFLQEMMTGSEDKFLLLFSLALCLPGPLLNVAAAVGVLVSGGSVMYGLAAWSALMLPGLLLVLAVIPVWGAAKTRFEGVGKASMGVNAAAIGMLGAATIQLYIATVGLEWTRTLAVLLGVALQTLWDLDPTFVVLLGLATSAAVPVLVTS
jgi:chromate transporter